MDLKITWTCHLKDEKWGFSDLLNGRELNEETKEEIKDLVEEDIYDAIYTNGVMAIEADTGESNCTIHGVSKCEGISAEATLINFLMEKMNKDKIWFNSDAKDLAKDIIKLINGC